MSVEVTIEYTCDICGRNENTYAQMWRKCKDLEDVSYHPPKHWQEFHIKRGVYKHVCNECIAEMATRALGEKKNG